MNNATKNLASTLQQNKKDGLLVNFTMLWQLQRLYSTKNKVGSFMAHCRALHHYLPGKHNQNHNKSLS